MANNEFGLSYAVIEYTADGGTNWTQAWSGYVENIEISTSVSTVDLRGATLNDSTATWTPYPREVKPSSIDATVRVSFKGSDADDISRLLQMADFNNEWRISFKTSVSSTEKQITGLKLTNKSGTLPSSDYSTMTIEFKQIQTA
jgi:hypothetical protein